MKLSKVLWESKSNAQNLTDMMKDIRRMGYINPIDDRDILIDNAVVLSAHIFDGKIYFDILTMSDSRGKGKASQVLKDLTQLADKHQVTLALQPQPFGAEKGLNTVQLISWYKRYGFKKSGFGDEMIRSHK